MVVGALMGALRWRAPATTFSVSLEAPAAAASPQDGDAFGSPHLGTAVLEPYELMEKQHFSGWLPLRGRTGRQQGLGKAQIRVSVDYFPTIDVGAAWPGAFICVGCNPTAGCSHQAFFHVPVW